mmetsp:Transcript_25464/g.58723  ORF Transcript_25464/g.58723 Transcript_25464/m.58723 type:complete len:86 (-) Transcript_25464:549-806(-)
MVPRRVEQRYFGSQRRRGDASAESDTVSAPAPHECGVRRAATCVCDDGAAACVCKFCRGPPKSVGSSGAVANGPIIQLQLHTEPE